MNLSLPFVRRPIGTVLLTIGVALAGIAAFFVLPVSPLPQVDYPVISVNASIPGASPETMATSVATPLERHLGTIAGVNEMTSTSSVGTSRVTLQFDLSRDINGAAREVQAAISASRVDLPATLRSNPTYRKANPASSPVIILALTSKTKTPGQIYDAVSNIVSQRLSQVEGVGDVEIGGGSLPAVRIELLPFALNRYGISTEDVRAAIQASNANRPKGMVQGEGRKLQIYTQTPALRASDYAPMVIAWRNGAAVRLQDVAEVLDGVEDTRTLGLFNGEPAIIVLITRQPSANIIETVDSVRALLPELQAQLPPDVTLQVASDSTNSIRGSLREVEFTLVISVILVVLVVSLFLRSVRATIVPAVATVAALLGTFGVMYLLGFSLNNLSLMALTVATGFVVDDAIVVLENTSRHIESGMTRMKAALLGAKEVGFTVLSISVSLVAVFIPLLLMGGIVGRLFREFAVTVTLTIVVSVVISLTLTPMLCSRFLKNEHGSKHGRLYLLFERGFDAMLSGYKRGLHVVLDHQFITLMVFIATVAATGVLFAVIPKGFFPQQDTGFISGFAESGQDASFASMNARMLQLADVVRKDPDVTGFGMNGSSSTYNTGNFFISLKPKDEGRTATADEIITRLRPQLAKVQGVNLFLQAGQDIRVGGRASRTQYQYTVTDADLGELNTWAPKLLARFKQLPELTDLATDQQNAAASAVLTIDRDRASSFGITPATIDATLYDAIGQRQVAQYFTQLNSYHVVLEVTPSLQQDPTLFSKLYLSSPITGQQVPLSTFVKVDTSKTAYLSISHQGQFPAVTISFNLAPGVALGDAVNAINKAQADMGLPQSLTGSFQGTAQAFQDSLASQPYLIAAALVAVYIVLGLLYESYIHPLTILSTLPSAGVGALLILMAGGYDLSVIALIGIILLIGIVKKNGIMMIDFALKAEREQGMSPHDAIYQACLLRFRPIMMTTMCALLSGLPLMLGHGSGSELRRPLGYAMVGGLILSQALTLFTTPVVYLYLDRAHYWYLSRKEARKARKAGKEGKAPVPAEAH